MAGPQPEPHQYPDADEVVDDRRPGHGHEAPPRVEQSRAQREEPVGGDLDHEPAQKRGGHLALEHDALDVGGRRVRIEHGQGVDEVGRRHECHNRRAQEDDDGHGQDGGDGLERLALVPVGQAIHEDRDEGGGEHPAQHDVVEHVRRGVGKVVRVGEEGLAERPRQGNEAEEPGEAQTPVPTAT